MSHTEFFIEGMTCEHCSATAAKALQSVEGVVHAEVDLDSRLARVEFDEAKTREEKLFAAIRNADFIPVKKNA